VLIAKIPNFLKDRLRFHQCLPSIQAVCRSVDNENSQADKALQA
jgi:hypothetical protein